MGREGRDQGGPAPWMDTPLGVGSPRERRGLPEKQWGEAQRGLLLGGIPSQLLPHSRPDPSVPSPQPQGPPIQSLLISRGFPPLPPAQISPRLDAQRLWVELTGSWNSQVDPPNHTCPLYLGPRRTLGLKAASAHGSPSGRPWWEWPHVPKVSLPALGLGCLTGKAGRLPPLRPPLSPTNRHPNQPSPEPRLHWVHPSTVSWVL